MMYSHLYSPSPFKSDLVIVKIPSMYDKTFENPDFAIYYKGDELCKLSKELWQQVKQDNKTYEYFVSSLIEILNKRQS